VGLGLRGSEAILEPEKQDVYSENQDASAERSEPHPTVKRPVGLGVGIVLGVKLLHHANTGTGSRNSGAIRAISASSSAR